MEEREDGSSFIPLSSNLQSLYLNTHSNRVNWWLLFSEKLVYDEWIEKNCANGRQQEVFYYLAGIGRVQEVGLKAILHETIRNEGF